MRKRTIIGSTLLVTLLTFGIKTLGLLKQAVLASICGANEETDAFFIATGILAQLCAVIFSAISISFLAMHTDTLVKYGRQASNELVNRVLRVFMPLACLISVAFYSYAPYLARTFAPAYSIQQIGVLSGYIRIMSPSFVLWCYYLIMNAVLETDKIFLPGKAIGFFQNVFLIIAAVFLYSKYGIISLVYGYLLAGLAQCVLVSICARKVFHPLYKRIDYWSEIKELISLAMPLIIGNAIYEINDIVDKQISTSLGEGNVSVLTYGGTINEIVTGVVVASVSTVMFAHFATWVSDGDTEKVQKSMETCLKALVMLIFPIMCMCVVAGDSIVRILYGRGNFGAREVSGTYSVVIGYAVGFVFQATRAIIAKVFYAFKDTRRPMINGIIAVGTNIGLSILMSGIVGISGVAYATSISMLIVTILLLVQLKRYLAGFSMKRLLPEMLKGLCGLAVSMITVVAIKGIGITNLYVEFLIEGLACVISYYIVLRLLRAEFVDSINSIINSGLSGLRFNH